MLRRIIAYILFVLGLLTVTFFRHYSGELISSPFLFWLMGLVMFLAGYLLLRYSSPPKNKAAMDRWRQLINDLKTNGEKISVDFKDCEIRGQSYSEKREPHGADTHLVALTTSPVLRDLMDHLDDPGGTGLTNVQQSVILFTFNNSRTGQTERFVSPVIPKDKVSLSFYLDQQQLTTLYVDRIDRNIYYFDLDFLSTR